MKLNYGQIPVPAWVSRASGGLLMKKMGELSLGARQKGILHRK